VLVLGCLIDMAPSILITTPTLLPVVMKFGVDPVHFGMLMLLNLGIGFCPARPSSPAAPSAACGWKTW
jgi:TRAP-type C4-dicarboxylate transport system permease large subunit